MEKDIHIHTLFTHRKEATQCFLVMAMLLYFFCCLFPLVFLVIAPKSVFAFKKTNKKETEDGRRMGKSQLFILRANADKAAIKVLR